MAEPRDGSVVFERHHYPIVILRMPTNGSVASIAGVCNPAGNVLGLMPHPENHVLPRQHPTAGLDPARDPERHLGLRIFRNGVAAAAQM